MSRPIPDLAKNLRLHQPDLLSFNDTAADVLDLLHKHLPQPKCDTCAGSGDQMRRTTQCCDCACSFGVPWAEDRSLPQCAKCAHVCAHSGTPFRWWPCPDCGGSGLLALDEHLRRVAAVIKALPDILTIRPTTGIEPFDFVMAIAGHFTDILYPHLRQIGRTP